MKFGTKIYYECTPTSDVVHLVYNSPVHTQFTASQLHNVYIYYTIFLRVSAINFGHFQGATILIDVNSVYGNLSYMTTRLYIVTLQEFNDDYQYISQYINRQI